MHSQVRDDKQTLRGHLGGGARLLSVGTCGLLSVSPWRLFSIGVSI